MLTFATDFFTHTASEVIQNFLDIYAEKYIIVFVLASPDFKIERTGGCAIAYI